MRGIIKAAAWIGHALASGAHYTVRTLCVEPGSAGRSQSAAFTEQVSSPARLDDGEQYAQAKRSKIETALRRDRWYEQQSRKAATREPAQARDQCHTAMPDEGCTRPPSTPCDGMLNEYSRYPIVSNASL